VVFGKDFVVFDKHNHDALIHNVTIHVLDYIHKTINSMMINKASFHKQFHRFQRLRGGNLKGA